MPENPGPAARTGRGRFAIAAAIGLVGLFLATGPWHVSKSVTIDRLSAVLAFPAIVFGICLAFRGPRRRLAAAFDAAAPRITRRRLAAVFALSFAFFLAIAANRSRALAVSAWDFSLYFDRPIEQSLHGRLLWNAYRGTSQLADDASWLLLAFIPLYAVKATGTWLLLAHAAALAGAVLAGFAAMRLLLADDVTAAVLALAFVFNSFTARVAQSPFHVEVFYPLAVFLAARALLAGNRGTYLASLALVASIKEDALLPLAGLALAAFVIGRPRRGIAALAAGTLIAAFDLLVVFPRLGGSPGGRPWFSFYWGEFGPTPAAALLGMARHPWRVAASVARSAVPGTLETLAFSPVLGGAWALAALPVLLVAGTTSHIPLSQLRLYYSAPILALLFLAAAAGITRVSEGRGGHDPGRRRRRLRLLAIGVAVVSVFDGGGYRLLDPNPARRDIADLIAKAPPDIPVFVQGALLPRAGYDQRVQVLEKRDVSAGAAVLLAPSADPYPFARRGILELEGALAMDAARTRIRTESGLVLSLPGPAAAAPR